MSNPGVDIAVTRMPGGFTNVDVGSLFQVSGLALPQIWHTFFDDFDTYNASDWTVTETSGSATEALTDGDGGLLLITNTTTDNDAVQMQKVGESFTFTAGVPLIFEARFKCSDVTQNDIVVGLEQTTATPLAPVNGVYFLSSDGVATVDFKVTKASVTTTASAIGTLVDATFVNLGFAYNGADTIWYGINGTPLGSLAVTNLPTTELTVTFGVQNGSAGVKTCTLDFLFASKKR